MLFMYYLNMRSRDRLIIQTSQRIQMYKKFQGYSILTSIFSVGFDVYDPAGQPAYYQRKHTFTTVKAAKNAIRQLIKKNGDKYLEENFSYFEEV